MPKWPFGRKSYFGLKEFLCKLEFPESDVSPGKTEVKQGKFVKLISPAKGYFRVTYKSQNINPISPTSKFNLVRAKSLSTSFQWLVQ